MHLNSPLDSAIRSLDDSGMPPEFADMLETCNGGSGHLQQRPRLTTRRRELFGRKEV